MDSYPNMWDISSAGHVSAGEDSVTSALREAQEELGLEIKPEDLGYLFSVTQQAVLKDGAYINNEFNDVYLVKLNPLFSDLKLQKEEVSSTQWVPYKELEKNITEGNNGFVPHPEEYTKLFVELHKRYP
jgi:isopentenyldiphosphate isomerase